MPQLAALKQNGMSQNPEPWLRQELERTLRQDRESRLIQQLGEVFSEHKHSGHDVIISGAGNACPICQAFRISELENCIKDLERQIDTYKEDQRVSAESFNWWHKRCQEAEKKLAVLTNAFNQIQEP